MTSKTTLTPASGTPALSTRTVDWRDLYAVAIRSVRQSLVCLLKSDDDLFDDYNESFTAICAALDLLDYLQKERPAAENDTVNWPLYKIKAVLVGADADSYPQRALDACINDLESVAGLATGLQDEAERHARETKERTARAIEARRKRKAAEAGPEGGGA